MGHIFPEHLCSSFSFLSLLEARGGPGSPIEGNVPVERRIPRSRVLARGRAVRWYTIPLSFMSIVRQDPPSYRVLCVDDDPDILHLLRKTFEGSGFEVSTCGSGEAALRWIEREGLPHLAVVDIRMPDLDGIELCGRVHAFSDLPVILLTAVDDEPTVVNALDTVAEDYILKPFRPAELVARTRRVLRRIGDFS